MALVMKDRVKVTATTTGTGDMSLGGAYEGYVSFASTVPDGSKVYYCIHNTSTGYENEWEVGVGTYTLGTDTLSRDTVYANSSQTAPSKVSFSVGTKEVFITYPAEKAIYEEPNGNTLIDGGPLTVVGSGVTSYTSFTAVLSEMYGNVPTFAQSYARNISDDSEASADMIVYRDNTTVDTANFMDMGINSSTFSSATWPIFTPGSMYLYGNGGEMFIGSETSDVVFFTGGVDTTDEAARFNSSTKAFTTVADMNVGGDFDVTGAATFNSTVTLDADPTTALEAATKQYVDAAASVAFVVHPAVQLATAAALNGNTYDNGTAGVGATLTKFPGPFAALVVDGVTVTAGQRILVKNESTAAHNGVYTVTTVGDNSTPWVLTRATDFDTAGSGEVANNAYFFVESGATNIGSSWVLSQTAAITVGTTALPFTLFSVPIGYTVNAPLQLDGTVLSLTGTVAATNGGTGTNTVATGDLLYGSATNTWSKLGIGSAYKSLVVNGAGTNVEWNAVALNQSGAVSGALPAANGGTGLSTYTLGDTLYASAATTIAKLAGNTTTTKKYLQQQGTGTASAAPSWQQIAAADISGLAASATTDTTNASNITSGTLPSAQLSGAYSGITGVGTIASGTWNGSLIPVAYGGTGQSTATAAFDALAPSQTGNSGKYLTTNGATVSWGTLSVGDGTLTLAVSGVGLSGSATFTANQAGASSFTVTSNATSANTASAIVARDASGNFSAGTITATLSGNASTATTATNASNVATTDDTSTNATHYVTFLAASSSNNPVKVSSTNLTFNPSTGNLVAGGNITAYSDERLKKDWKAFGPDFISKLANVKVGTYTRVDSDEKQVGVSAQSLKSVLPEAVITSEKGYLSVAYGNAALAAVVELAKEIVALRTEIKALKGE